MGINHTNFAPFNKTYIIMRKLINLLVIVVMTLMAILPLTSQAAETPSYEVTLQQTDPDPEHDPDPAQKGK